MPAALPRDAIYRRRRFPAEAIEQCVRWYLTYRLSYRDVVDLMAERGLTVSHTTIMRWVLRYVPEYEKRWARFTKPIHSSWRMDETAVRVQGQWKYLYRAVDRDGKSVHSLLCVDRAIGSAQEFFRQAIRVAGFWPSKINLDGNAASHRALRLLRKEDVRWQTITVRARRYLNNVIEQDHRAIKQRCAPMLGHKSFKTAAITFSGIELAHRIRKRQFMVAYKRRGRTLSLRELWDQALSDRNVPVSLDNKRLPLTHQISPSPSCPRVPGRPPRSAFVRYQRKVSFGHGLHLLVVPRGSRYWRFRYRFEGQEKLISLGCYPAVPIQCARARQQQARQLLALGVDPARRGKALRQIFAGLAAECRGATWSDWSLSQRQ
ncbi:MAG TPA: IS6 family transposase [Steroidobacteraceae bacterium]|jgi:transposase-like protein